ncbi:ABC transporter ATP-binding protein [Palleronia sediminis]|uniref:ABC transporter ATP-binding protein n=1 Tax=Palleronia sediminis TaxID=2547833 RepID=A0A4R6AB54_9RHOB|nr:ABC transporter ATP-binding protein [Palleronia sediminis]TDL78353.1 ABC transporter ATP-binding protein [Palleronia sediminis]
MTRPGPTDPRDGPVPADDVLSIRGLSVGFAGFTVLDGIDLTVRAGELVCIVGESGSGKSLTALATMGLAPPGARIAADCLRFTGRDLLPLTERERQTLRGNEMAMIFQEPMTSLNPVMTVGEQIMEPLRQHRRMGARQARETALAMLSRVQVPAPEARFDQYPHQLSGGLRQRVMIAMALVCRPRLLIADEPTTALDVTIQAQILRLVDELRHEMGTSILFITHDLAVVSEIADRIAVIYAGRIVEEGTRDDIFDDPQHPYTLALFAALPRPEDKGRDLASIRGQVPGPDAMPGGCRFAPRCPFAIEKCRAERPPLLDMPGRAHRVACWRAPLEESVR